MKSELNRRDFLKRSSLLTAGFASGLTVPSLISARSPGERIVVGIVGCNNRGMDHIAAYLSIPNAEIGYVCDVDSRAIEKGITAVSRKQAKKPKGLKDLRRILDDPEVDAISIATPDHWHAPATILACAAGKHVYVEKPGSHNGRESEQIVAAASKHHRVVQMGNQRRSWPWVSEAIAALQAGEIGKLFVARCWYTNHRGSIGHGKAAQIPEWLDYDLWQGPAPARPFLDNVVHYNWHWFWNWGTGELGNNGVHALDLARWGLGLDQDYPRRVTCGGNRYHYDDDWETPDTIFATFDFGTKGIVWEGRSCDPRGLEGASFGVIFYGENGSMAIAGERAAIYDLNDKPTRQISGKFDDVVHFANFLDGIRGRTSLRAEIATGQRSSLLCHLGNMAWRTGQTIDFDPQTHKLIGHGKVTDFWKRTYRKGWEPVI